MCIFGAAKMHQTSALKPMLIIKFTNIKKIKTKKKKKLHWGFEKKERK